MVHVNKRVAIAGVPNCGKTTFFNAVTGAKHRVGNWPGVTVEKVQGTLTLRKTAVDLIDLPGTYNLSPDTEEQKIAEQAIRDHGNELVLNIVDASNLSRNLFLTMDIMKRQSNMVVFLNMTDIAEKEGIKVNHDKLEKELGVPVIPVISIDKHSIKKAKELIEDIVTGKTTLNESPRLLVTETDDPNEVYRKIDAICEKVIEKAHKAESMTDKIDKVVLNRFLSIPIFLGVMFLTFWFAVNVGGIFIDFFDMLTGLVFVDGLGALLNAAGSPQWLVTLLAGGVGAGIQTVSTFIPVVFFMFLALAILEDLGFMSRTAVITDRLMKSIGLPGNAFIPLMVGFGCTVPAIMSARTMTSKRDRYMTIFMVPFMSCGARLPVYALFSAALFQKWSGVMVFLIYLVGILMAVLTGLLLKNTIFKGTHSNFVMDLPLYHTPRPGSILKTAGIRLTSFVKKAGLIMAIAVTFLGFLNSLGIEDGAISFGNEDTQTSVLAYAGKSLQPVFEPMGVSEENWPASVALFTGMFAKEAIVSTVNSLYASMDFIQTGTESIEDETGGIDVAGTIVGAFSSVGQGFIDLFSSFDLLGVSSVTENSETISKNLELEDTTLRRMQHYFTPMAGFAYLLFVLMYFPCLAAMGAAYQEMGPLFTAVQMVYLTILAWSTSTLFYQLAEGHNPVYLIIAAFTLGIIYIGMTLLGKKANPFTP